MSTSRISDIQLRLNQKQQDLNDLTNKFTTLIRTIDNQKDEIQKLDSQRSELQIKYDSSQDSLKNERLIKKQLQTKITNLEDELAEMKVSYNNTERSITDRKIKHEMERKRLQDEMDELKLLHEHEIDDLRNKLRKQRTVDSVTTTQEIARIEQDLTREWQEKLDRQQTQHERSFNMKTKELDGLKRLLDEKDDKLQTTHAEISQLKEQNQLYEEKCEKLQERISLVKDKYVELKDEQQQLIGTNVKRIVNMIFQSMKLKIKSNKSYTGEKVLTRALDIIKKSTVKLLSGEDEIQSSSSEEDEEETNIISQSQPSTEQETVLTTSLDATMVMIMSENNRIEAETGEHNVNEENEQSILSKNDLVDSTVLFDTVESEQQQQEHIKTDATEETTDEQKTTNNHNQSSWDTIEEFQKSEITSVKEEDVIQKEVEQVQQQQNEEKDVDIQQSDETESILDNVPPISVDETSNNNTITNLTESTVAEDKEDENKKGDEHETDINESSIAGNMLNDNRVDVDDSPRPSMQETVKPALINESSTTVSFTQPPPKSVSRNLYESIPLMSGDDDDDLFK
ncbi:unnamed protein product [Didymodactylos carnosus]|uniref:FK506-binding protein 15-like domain-containing protein n=1 Tax=Didymodactylos carnosus TaxID=1234261 RepID=A0A8S2FAP8_9BILA|nr:unnamed protein product [Didymodactylos carnosus]CAF4209487.1 unnamed protein product [Didymodactylos carnosus]